MVDCPGFNFIDFEAVTIDGETSDLTWMTKYQETNSLYVIERSNDGISFNTVDLKLSNGLFAQDAQYEMKDDKPRLGNNWYRIKYLEPDGDYVYSNVELVVYEASENPDMFVYPNPFNEQFTIEMLEPLRAGAFIQIVDNWGQVIQRHVTDNHATKYSIDLSEHPDAPYFIYIKYDQFNFATFKIVKITDK